MSWLDNFFSKKSKDTNDVAQANLSGVINPNMEKFEKIFVDETQPAPRPAQDSIQPVDAARAAKMNLIEYLQSDHRSRGNSDGYNFHSVEKLDSKLRQMRAEFCYLISVEIDQLQSMLATLEIEKIKADSPYTQELCKTLGVRVEQVQLNIEHLRAELDLCAVEDGLFMHPVESYRDGYLKGMSDFHEIETMINVSGILNR